MQESAFRGVVPLGRIFVGSVRRPFFQQVTPLGRRAYSSIERDFSVTKLDPEAGRAQIRV
jgi:hypothetical protein